MPVDRLTGGRVGEFFDRVSPTLPEWASFVPSRNPAFKIHKGRGQAFGALSDKMPHYPCLILKYDQASMAWKVFLDFVPPTTCERCGGPFEYGPHYTKYWRGAESRLGDNRPQWQRDIICKVCDTADQIDSYIENDVSYYLPNGIGQSAALTRLIEVEPVYKARWDECVERHHEYKKRMGKI